MPWTSGWWNSLTWRGWQKPSIVSLIVSSSRWLPCPNQQQWSRQYLNLSQRHKCTVGQGQTFPHNNILIFVTLTVHLALRLYMTSNNPARADGGNLALSDYIEADSILITCRYHYIKVAPNQIIKLFLILQSLQWVSEQTITKASVNWHHEDTLQR